MEAHFSRDHAQVDYTAPTQAQAQDLLKKDSIEHLNLHKEYLHTGEHRSTQHRAWVQALKGIQTFKSTQALESTYALKNILVLELVLKSA